MPDSKTYRPKSGVEGLSLTANYPHEKVLDLKPGDFPYTTEDAEEQRFLDGVDQLTDRPDTRNTERKAPQAEGDPNPAV